MRIAWIDDDTEIIEPVIQPLVQDGHEITRIRTVRDALDSAETLGTCDLILLDMIIPPGDCDEDFGYYSGVPLLRMLREEHGVTTPVIVFSVVDPDKVEEQLDPLNVVDYVRKPALPAELLEAVQTAQRGGREMRIAWIDDDTEIIEPVIQPLARDGHEIIRIRTVRDALNLVETLRTSDLILMDVILPPGELDEDFEYYSGVPLLRRLREEHGVTTPVIIFSVVDSNRITEQLDPLNVADYVLKPALPTELKEAVDTVLRARRNSGAGK